MNTRKVNTLKKFIENNHGKFIGITFKKTNGEVRDMVFRTGISSGTKPTKATIKRKETNAESGMIDVFDIKNGFRSINLATATRISVNGKTRTFK